MRRQTGRQMDRQGQDPNPLHGHPAKIFNLKCSWHLRTKCIMDILLLLLSTYRTNLNIHIGLLKECAITVTFILQ